MEIKQLIKQARQFYPKSKSMRHQWIRKTLDLNNRGCHLLQTGKFRFGSV